MDQTAREAQQATGIVHPISWHDLRHLFVSLLIAAGKHPKFIASAARHRDPGFSLRTYGHLFDSMLIAAVEWWDDLLWPAGCPYLGAENVPAHGTAEAAQITSREEDSQRISSIAVLHLQRSKPRSGCGMTYVAPAT